MASSYNTRLRRFNGTDYDTMYPETVAGIVKYSDGTTLEANRTKTVNISLPTTGWSSTAPYTLTVTVNGVTAKTNGILGIASTATEAQYAEAMECGLRLTAQGTNTITIAARLKKPTVAIPLQLIITGVSA